MGGGVVAVSGGTRDLKFFFGARKGNMTVAGCGGETVDATGPSGSVYCRRRCVFFVARVCKRRTVVETRECLEEGGEGREGEGAGQSAVVIVGTI